VNESTYTQYYLRKLREQGIYTLKLMLNFNNGVPDVWLSGTAGDIWIEFKYINKVPKRQSTKIKPNLSDLQSHWLNGRYYEGRKVCVILGSEIGSYVFTDLEWNSSITRDDLTLSRQDVITWITQQIHV